MNCIYCQSEIFTDYYGWGYYWQDVEKIPFHMECIEIYEDV